MRTKLLTLLFASLLALPLAAQKIDCPTSEELPKIPELVAKNGKLRGTIVVRAEQDRIAFRVPASAPATTSTYDCYPQWIRVVRGFDTTPAMPAPATPYPDPMPGPTLRARVGDLIELTLLNQVDPNVFPYSMDQGEKQYGCDQTSLYPGTSANADTFPNCFHGSSTANIHFHGTHTSPSSTGDNVFLEVRPSPRTKNEANKPLVTSLTVKAPFDEFFAQCEKELIDANPEQLRQWPRVWKSLPQAFREKQELLLKQYDDSNVYKQKLWPVNAKQIAQGAWPQYYIGAFPYCFKIPVYTQAVWPPVPPDPSTSSAHTHTMANTKGAGTAEEDIEVEPGRLLQMGQSPGTQWYHAHKHGSTTINVSNGMVGAFILEGKYDDDLNSYYGTGWTRTQPTMVINQIGVSPNLERGGGGVGKGQDKGPDFSVNGRLRPIVTMAPGEVQMWRIVNTSSRAGIYFPGPPTGFQWKQLAQDGVQFADVNYQGSLNESILLMPGNRADFLVMAPTTPPNGQVAWPAQNEVDPSDLASAAVIPLLYVNVTGTAKSMAFIPTAPTQPPFLADIQDSEITGTKKLDFASTPPLAQHTIDGHKFSGEVGEVVLLNTVEEWKITNATYGPLIAHPFHIHINPFQVTEVFAPNDTIPDPDHPGQTLPRYVFSKDDVKVAGQCPLDAGDPKTWKPCGTAQTKNLIWWDVFPIPSGKQVKDAGGNVIASIPGYFKMRSRFVDYKGYYVLHCHILAHEDRGMMTVVEVAPIRSPYSHH